MNLRALSVLLACATVAALCASTAFASSTVDKPHAPGTHKRTYDRVFKHNVSKKNKKWAKRVARCESGYSVNAQNGQYLGLFQMGSNERRLFGHGESALVQAQAAYRYFVRSGRDWSPWSCKPWY